MGCPYVFPSKSPNTWDISQALKLAPGDLHSLEELGLVLEVPFKTYGKGEKSSWTLTTILGKL